MSEKIISFSDVCAINVNDKAEKKNGLTYLSWAWAWAEFVKVYQNATYEIVKNTNGMPYFKDECGAFVYTKVDNGNLIHEMWLPVMDNRNQAIKNPDAMAINKAVMRCLTKNLAMFGLGLYIYAGEDLPEAEEVAQKEEANYPTASKQTEADKKRMWKEFQEYVTNKGFVVADVVAVMKELGVDMTTDIHKWLRSKEILDQQLYSVQVYIDNQENLKRQ